MERRETTLGQLLLIEAEHSLEQFNDAQPGMDFQFAVSPLRKASGNTVTENVGEFGKKTIRWCSGHDF